MLGFDIRGMYLICGLPFFATLQCCQFSSTVTLLSILRAHSCLEHVNRNAELRSVCLRQLIVVESGQWSQCLTYPLVSRWLAQAPIRNWVFFIENLTPVPIY